jgi:predicted nucleotidyltransferase component of viral defense system
MIGKQDVLDRAAEWQLRPEVVEKDYVLGWLLAALGTHEETARRWVFKGGTCIKKCFVETYRFSEDLDFTLRQDAVYDDDGLRAVLREVARVAEGSSGIVFHADDLVLRPRQNRLGEPTYEVRVGYRGPLAMPGQPKVRLDLTRFEPIVLTPERRSIFHEYPDGPLPAGGVACYVFDELVAEKTRALRERTRPRDLYDVVLILENHAADLTLSRVREVLEHKCAAKSISMPTTAELVELARESEELRSEWANMLGHQLPALPDLTALLDRLPVVLGWLDVAVAVPPAPRLPLASLGRGPLPPLEAPRSGRYWGMGLPLDVVRFAGANRLLVSFVYDGRLRLVEPYSLRRPATGNLLLYAWELASGHIKAFNVQKMHDVRVTERTFVPKYRVELTA